MENTAQNQSVLLITGMHRSGTSLTASLLQSAGVKIGERLMGANTGNQLGHFEDLDFVEFHQNVLQSQGISIAGWTKEQSIQVQEQYLLTAQSLIESKISGEIWGWKDPRTTLFLDFWSKLIPQAKFVFVYRSPWEVVDSLFRRGDIIFKHNPNFAIQQWGHYNRGILDFYNRAIDKCILLRIEDVISSPEFLVNSINQKFNLNLRSPESLYNKSAFQAQAINSYRASLIKEYFSEEFNLYLELNQQAQLTESADLSQINNFTDADCKSWILQDWIDIRWEAKAKKQSQQQLESTTAELTQSQQQLESTTAQLSQFRSQLNPIKEELSLVQQKLQETNEQLTRSQQNIKPLREQLRAAKQQLELEQEELTELRRKLTPVEEELTRSQQKSQIIQKQKQQLQILVTAMESSKFWQLRKEWFEIKQKINLPVQDAIYQNYLASLAQENSIIENLPVVKYSGNNCTPNQKKIRSDNGKYQKWLEQNYPKPGDLNRMVKTVSRLQYKPLISIIVPVYNPPERFLREAIESVLKQVYPHWELCLADDCSTKPYVRAILKEYAQKDDRIKVVFREENGHICRTSNSALAIATGEYIALLDHDDLLAPHALSEVALLLNQHPEADFIYSDEDKVDEQNIHKDPFFKPDWCPDSFLSRMYTCHLGVYRRALVSEIGNFREGFEGSQDYDLVLRLTEKTDNIFHLPTILYHWRIHDQSAAANADAKPYATDAAQKALKEAIARRGEPGRVIPQPNFPGVYTIRYEIQAYKKVSIIIPTKDLAATLDVCLQSIFSKTTYPNYEVIVIDNGSVELETFRCFKYWQQQEPQRFKSYSYDIPFNYSQINNYAVEKASGDYLLFLNNDTEVITPDWIEAMVEQAQRPSIGVVGTLLLYPDKTIQHAGVVLGIGGVAGHSHKHLPFNQPGYISQAVSTNNYSAVTGACLMCRREVFAEIRGFDTDLAVAFNDIDFCLKILEQGYRNVYLPHVVLYHYESKSRGQENTSEKQVRFAGEVNYMKQKWQALFDCDPCYNPHLTRVREDYSLAV